MAHLTGAEAEDKKEVQKELFHVVQPDTFYKWDGPTQEKYLQGIYERAADNERYLKDQEKGRKMQEQEIARLTAELKQMNQRQPTAPLLDPGLNLSNGLGLQRQPDAPILTTNTQRSTELNNFKRNAPTYIRGETAWEHYIDRFETEMSDYSSITEADKKKVLYNKLGAEAQLQACPDYNPTKPEYSALPFKKYASELGELFEPPCESGQAKLEFDLREQEDNEHAADYFQAKLVLFHKAWRNNRDYEYFYDQVIKKMTNSIMRAQLYQKIPKKLTDTHEFKNAIMMIATIIRKQYHNGDIDEAQARGAEAFTTVRVKNPEVITINAVKKNDKCFHCGDFGHYRAQCPKKAMGIPPTVNPAIRSHRVEKQKATYTGDRNSFPQAKKKWEKKPNFNSQYKHKGKQGRIMFVYGDEAGEICCEDIEDTEIEEAREEPEDDTPPVGAEIHAIRPEEIESASDYIPQTFLGGM